MIETSVRTRGHATSHEGSTNIGAKSSIKSFYSILLYSESESANNVTWLRPLSTYVTDIQLPLPLDLYIPTSQMYHMTHKYLDIAV